ncbi:RidA family protein [Paraburkholderia caribensis]|nr:hypothetical protein [Paraburkholderia caribensis]
MNKPIAAIEKIARWLRHIGGDHTFVLNATIYLTDMSLVDERNEA